MPTKPVAASALSMTGGSIVIFSSLLIYPFGYFVGGPAFGVTGLLAGAMMVLGGVGVYFMPGWRRGWGLLVLAASALSIYGLFGGYFVGLALGVAGGIKALRWRPKAEPLEGVG